MKYIKLFEKKILNDILDKISDKGMDSLTNIEKEYLSKYKDDKEKNRLEDIIKKGKEEFINKKEYDPREDKDFFNEIGIDFSDWSDDEIEEGRYAIMWDDLRDEYMIEFIEKSNLPEEIINKPWDHLHINIRNKFKEFINDSGLLI